MARYFDCPYLGAQVELTDERERYLRLKHPETLPADADLLGETLRDPDIIKADQSRPGTRRFFRWYDDLKRGKYLVVAVVSGPERHWVVTAFVARRLSRGTVEWQR